MEQVIGFLRKLCHRVFTYLDDFFGAAKPRRPEGPTGRTETREPGRFIQLLLEKLSLTLKPQKCEFDGTTRLDILGILVDTESVLFLLPLSKAAKIEATAGRLLRYASRNSRFVRTKDVQRFAGLVKATSPAVVDFRLRLRELFNSPTPPESRLGSDHRLWHTDMRDLQWWARISRNPYVGRAIWPNPEVCVFTDESMFGWDATWQGEVPASGFFNEREEGAHTNDLVLTATLHALETFLPFARARHVQLVPDSLGTKHIVKNLTSRSPRLLHKLRTLRTLCERNGIAISTRHRQSVINYWADRLSLRRDTRDWRLPSDARVLLQRRFVDPLYILDGHELLSRTPPPERQPLVVSRPFLLGVWTRWLDSRGGAMASPTWPHQQWYQTACRSAKQTALTRMATPL